VVVGVGVVVAEVAAEVALGVEVDDEGSPAGVGGDAGELGGEGGLAGATLAVSDGDQVVEHGAPHLGVELSSEAPAEVHERT
jgi:hypothetical protein